MTNLVVFPPPHVKVVDVNAEETDPRPPVWQTSLGEVAVRHEVR